MTKNIPLSEIVDNPFQPRTEFDKESLRSLADEIKAEGFWGVSLQGRRKNGHIELVFGHRRLRALKMLKAPSVPIEIVDLTDADMALRSLEENLQREGLADLDKADAVKKAVEITEAELRAANKNESHAKTLIAQRLGLSVAWVHELCEISSGIPEEKRAPVRAGLLSAVTAHRARKWGGDAYVKTLTRQAKEGSKPSQTTVDRMRAAVSKVPEPVREKVKEEVITGKLTEPKQVEPRARVLSAQHTRRQKEPPPDLKEVIVSWTHRLKDWEKEMRDVEPYMSYVEEVPAIAERFRDALKQLMKTAEKLL